MCLLECTARMALHSAVLIIALFLPGQAQPSLSVANTLTMEQAAAHALTARPGSVIGGALVLGQRHTKYVFEIQAPEGIWRVKVDAISGQVLRSCLVDNLSQRGCGLIEHRHLRVKATTSRVLPGN
jgi:Peptidase propeptide and YPEB domain